MNLHPKIQRCRHLIALAFGKLKMHLTPRMKAVNADLRSLGRDSIRAGLAALVINAWSAKPSLMAGGLTALIVGLVAWVYGLPRDDEDPPPKS